MQTLNGEYIQGSPWNFKPAYYNTVVTGNTTTKQKIDVTDFSVYLMIKQHRSLTSPELIPLTAGTQGTDVHEKICTVPASLTSEFAAGNGYYGEITLVLQNGTVFKKTHFKFNVTPALAVTPVES